MKHAFRLPGDRLPTNRDARDAVLGDYFAERVASSMRDGEEWVVDVSTAPALDFYADARLQEGLEWWGDGLHVENVPLVWRDMDRWQLSLNDSWTLYAWKQVLRSCRVGAGCARDPARRRPRRLDDSQALDRGRLLRRSPHGRADEPPRAGLSCFGGDEWRCGSGQLSRSRSPRGSPG